MAYCTLIDIQNQITATTLMQLTDDEQVGVLDEGKVDGAIAIASDDVDSYLRGRYPTLPLPDPVPGVIVKATRDLAIYQIYSRRGEGGIPEHIKKAEADARKLLEDITAGTRLLGIEPASGSGLFVTNKTACDRHFDEQAMRDYRNGGVKER